MKKGTKKLLRGIGITAGVLIALFAGMWIALYAATYPAKQKALTAMETYASQNRLETSGNNQLAFVPSSDYDTGLIFYPGAMVDYRAYAPVMERLADNGILCIVIKMPGNMAFFDIGAADGVSENWPEVKHWYLGGHSLGGAMSANYMADHSDEYEGLILCAAYATNDLTQSGLRVFSIYGDQDMVLNRENYKKYYVNLPADAREYVIEGGCHGYFGDYGPQKGDGIPTISEEEQWNLIADQILNWINTK